MSALPAPPPGIASSIEELDCYSGLYSSTARVLVPRSRDELRVIFAYAAQNQYRVTLRAGAHSFDAQSLGDSVVVSMMGLNEIEVDRGQKRVSVGPGATWGAILAKLGPHGLVPAVTVTTAHASAGGTLAGDCLSRFSPAYGKEGKWVKSFELLTTDGRLLVCTPPDENAPRPTWTLEQEAFCGVIGGLGYLGAVVAITYEVLSVGQTGGGIGVHTSVTKHETFKNLARDLVPTTRRTHLEKSDPRDESKLDAIYSALSIDRDGNTSALVFTSTITTTTDRRPMLLFRPELARRVLVEWLMRVPLFCRLIWKFAFCFLYRDDKDYIDDLAGFTFFMDGDARAKRIGKRLGFKMRTVQQTFVVPADPVSERDWDAPHDRLVAWLEHAHELLRRRGLTPTLQDVLFLPRDLPFPLSASAVRPGFAVSYAFETSNSNTIARVQQAFIDLADDLWKKFGGRVYLVKNVYAKKTTLAQMYGAHRDEFFSLKRRLDPGDILRNEFLERTLIDDPPPAPGQPASPPAP